MQRAFVAAVIAALLSGCAQRAENIAPAYVSASPYARMSCEQLVLERNKAQALVEQLSRQQNDAATRDTVATTAAILIFAPAALILLGDEPDEQLATAKGQLDAIRTAASAAGCPL